MNKIIRRLAVVAVAALLCSGPGLAWGALSFWDGSGFDHTINLTDTSADSATIVRDTFDLTSFDDGEAGFTSGYSMSIAGNILTTVDPRDHDVTVTIPWASTPTGVYAWGAMFPLVSGLPMSVTFTVGLADSVKVDLPDSTGSTWAGFQIKTGTFTDFSISVAGLGGVSPHVSFKAPKFDTTRPEPPTPAVPEPTTLAIWSLLSLIGLAVVRRRRRV